MMSMEMRERNLPVPRISITKKNPTCESGGKNTVTPGAIFYPSAKHDPRKNASLFSHFFIVSFQDPIKICIKNDDASYAQS